MATKPFAGFEWMIAGRYLRARRKERAISAITGFSLVGIMLGVATLIIVMSVMNGFRFELVNRILGVNGHILVLPGGQNIENYDELAERISKEVDVLRAAPIIEGRVMASSRRGNTGVLVRGVSPENAKTLEALANPETAQGSLDDFGVDGGVAIGSGIAQELGLVVGDSVKLISPRGLRTVLGPAPATIRSFRIAYVFQVGMTEYDKILLYMPLDEAQKFFLKPDRVDQIEVMIDNPDEVEETAFRLLNTLEDPVRMWTWKDQNGGYLKALRTERVVMFVILSLIILVAALNIISGLIMLVKDKGRDIGILRTIGLTKGAVMRVFFICGSSIGVVGTILGVILGTLFAANIKAIQAAVEWVLGVSVWDPSIRYLTEIPAILHASDVMLTTAIALALSFIATLYPAWRAARMNPVEALRYE